MSRGTKFRLYPQWNEGWIEPEVVIVSSPQGSLAPGPASSSLRAILPVDKAEPYDPPSYRPPFRGPCRAPAVPDRHGDFDHIDSTAPQFLPAHLFGCVRWTLDIWESYLRQEVVWWHAEANPQLELCALVDWNNAQSGPGFIEMGARDNLEGVRQLFALNFDVVAHETGHTILFATIGVPPPDRLRAEFLAFHESFSDLVALVAALHFPSVATLLLAQTSGDLYVLNLVSRIGEMSSQEQIRTADNTVTMDDVAGLRLEADGSWFDPAGQGRNAHALAQPLSGAMFDLFVEVFQQRLAARGGLPGGVDTRRWNRHEAMHHLTRSLERSARALARSTEVFDAALAEARDVLGAAMAHVMRTVEPDRLSFDVVAGLVLENVLPRPGMPPTDDLIEIFLIRGIDPRPTLHARALPLASAWGSVPYAERARRVVRATHALHAGLGCRCGPASFLHANRLICHPERAA